MKLARKLTLAILAVMVAVLTLNAVELVRRDRAALRDDIRRDHRALGHALQVVVLESFREDGEQRALALVEAANQRESTMQVSWHWLANSPALSALPAADRSALQRRLDVDTVVERAGAPWLLSYYPIRLHDQRVGVIQVGESLAAEAEAERATVVRAALSTGAIGLLAALVTNLLGIWLVGRPVAQLMDKARRVGSGDYGGTLEIVQRDELGDLAHEMNTMSERLDNESRARQRALEQLRHAERLATVGTLAAGIAHELGTPLNVISIEAKRIAVGRAVGAAAEEGASIVVTQAERMADIIRQLLDFARRRTPRPLLCDLRELVTSTTALVGSLAARQRVTLQLTEDSPARVYVDPGQLKQVLTNLIVNAIQAIAEGGTVQISTGTEALEEAPHLGAYVRVKDSGIGIAEEAVHRIFEPFFTTKDVGQGTGLGLAVAHGIIEEHGGRIEVNSKVGEGATFTVRLPMGNPTEAV